MKGKRGPKPPIVDDPTPEDPTAEEIVGPENVVAVASDIELTDDDVSMPAAGYTCSHCTFTCNLFSELEQHTADTGHGRDPVETVQPELFSTPGIVHKMMNVMLPAELLNEKRARLADLYQKQLEIRDEKKSFDDDCNARLKNIDNQMQEIARVLKTPFTYEKVECEYRVISEENARGLYRLDTGELLEKQPLTQEDMEAERQRAEAANQEPVVAQPEAAAEAVSG